MRAGGGGASIDQINVFSFFYSPPFSGGLGPVTFPLRLWVCRGYAPRHGAARAPFAHFELRRFLVAWALFSFHSPSQPQSARSSG